MQLKFIAHSVIIIDLELQMSDANQYTKELEKLVITKLLPVYKEYCQQNNIDIMNSGIPWVLLRQINVKNKLPALLREKESGC